MNKNAPGVKQVNTQILQEILDVIEPKVASESHDLLQMYRCNKWYLTGCLINIYFASTYKIHVKNTPRDF